MSTPLRPLSARLFRPLMTPASALSDVELRLVRIANELFGNLCIQLRCDGVGDDRGVRALDPALVARAAELAIVAAVAIERPLRDVRDQLEDRALKGS